MRLLPESGELTLSEGVRVFPRRCSRGRHHHCATSPGSAGRSPWAGDPAAPRGALGMRLGAGSWLHDCLRRARAEFPQRNKVSPGVSYVVVPSCQIRELLSPWVYPRICFAVSRPCPCVTSAYPSSPLYTSAWRALSHGKVKRERKKKRVIFTSEMM